ncbi:uncharacterized protein LOC126374190 [Pectinophora gossypiella]|nr:uncharacterized protein LOC126374190 [Pectinophora gossypiella]
MPRYPRTYCKLCADGEQPLSNNVGITYCRQLRTNTTKLLCGAYHPHVVIYSKKTSLLMLFPRWEELPKFFVVLTNPLRVDTVQLQGRLLPFHQRGHFVAPPAALAPPTPATAQQRHAAGGPVAGAPKEREDERSSGETSAPDAEFRGGRLRHFRAAWSDRGAPAHILDIINGSTEHDSGQPLKIRKTSRVAPHSNGMQRTLHEVGHPVHRPVRVAQRARSPSIREQRPARPARSSLRRVQPGLELQPGLGVSPSLPDATSLAGTQPSTRQVHNNLPTMVKRTVESRSQTEGAELSIYHPTPTSVINRHKDRPATPSGGQVKIGGMAGTGWDDLLQDWSPTKRSLIEASWRPSTLKTYRQAWTKWITWV